jgi:hypothetical protein
MRIPKERKSRRPVKRGTTTVVRISLMRTMAGDVLAA